MTEFVHRPTLRMNSLRCGASRAANPLRSAPLRLWGRMPVAHRIAARAAAGGTGYLICEMTDE